MTFLVRDGSFDVAVLAGPQVNIWPSAGVRTLSFHCADMGLNVGVFGGEGLNVRGVIPLPGTGGIILIEDSQHRLHRIRARAIVRFSSPATLPDPFPGWRSAGLIPLSTAIRLRNEGLFWADSAWEPSTVILGTGNQALSFGTSLLESGVSEVYCVESFSQWGAKRFSGWEVERRRFEMLGGKLIEAKPVKLSAKSPLLWELRLQDGLGIRVIDTARVVAAGPFTDLPGVREYPPGSFLFEVEQTAGHEQKDDVQGWVTEVERGRWLAGRIVKTLVTELGDQREKLDQLFRRARSRLRKYGKHRELPFTPTYQGKWISMTDAKTMRSFEGVPKQLQKHKPIASIECFEDIPCDLCARVCPDSAIDIGRVLSESKCTGCGLCLAACPSSTPVLLHEKEDQSMSKITIAWKGIKTWSPGEFATLVNRRGESLGSGRIVTVQTQQNIPHLPEDIQLVEVEIPTHLIWEARNIRKPKTSATTDKTYVSPQAQKASEVPKVDITLNGEKRLVRDSIPLSLALYETGYARADDVLFCNDGSCAMCSVSVDGIQKLACRTSIHKGMAVKLEKPVTSLSESNEASAPNLEGYLCPCLGITRSQVIERMKQGTLKSPEAVISISHVGEGKCHGQLCMEALRRVVLEEGIDASQWIDWRFPWSEWVLIPSSS